MIEQFIDVVLLSFLAIIAVSVLHMRRLFSAVMLTGIYSLLSAALFVVLDAVDVAFTEAAVGAGIATILMLETLAITTDLPRTGGRNSLIPLVIVVFTGAALIYGTLDMPRFGDANAPIHRHVVERYIEDTPVEVGIPNIVTSVLASYRGYDTLGEVVVIFTAGVGVLGLLGSSRRKRSSNDDRDS